MSRKKRQSGAQKAVRTGDGYNNFAAKLGGYIQHPERWELSAGYISRNRVQLETCVSFIVLVGAGVDAMADDMTRKGINISSKLEPGQKGKFEMFWDDIAIWDGLNDTLKWSPAVRRRAAGGAAGRAGRVHSAEARPHQRGSVQGGEKGINFRSITDGVDLKTASGRYNFRNILSAAQYESDLNSERTLAGLAVARGKRASWWSQPKFTDEQWREMGGGWQPVNHDKAYQKKTYGVGLSTLYKKFPAS